jgi:outer membrane protein OmpA-like peptidoglycan-associated protein
MLAALVLGGCASWPVGIARPYSIRHLRGLQSADPWDYSVGLTVHDLHFSSGESAIRAEDRALLVSAVPALNRFLRDAPDLVFVIEGHCDDGGSARFDRELALQRALAVREVLVGAGLPAARLRTASVGDRERLCAAPDDSCREQNRRVHLRAAQVTGKLG